MTTSANQVQALLDLAIKLFKKKDPSPQDLSQCESTFLKALDGRVELLGADHADVAFIHWYLGLLYSKMKNSFDEGEAHFTAASLSYTDPLQLATLTSHHASLLEKKGNLIREEAEELGEGADESDAALYREISKLRDEAAETFRKVADMREKAFTVTSDLATAAETAKKAADKAAAKTAKTTSKAEPIEDKSPAEIVAILDQVAIGQKAAKRGLANLASQHIKRMKMPKEKRDQTDKSNGLLVGPTGCGKTLLAHGLASAINVPFYATEATKLTASGYVGEDVQSVLVGLLRACDFDVERAQNGIIYIDEIDKITGNADTSLDVGGTSVQEELLTILEGTKISVPKDGNNKTKGEYIEIDTTNILFIGGGAFSGLEDIVVRRVCKTSIGFAAQVRGKDEDNSPFVRQALAEDFIKFGLIPEFVGRLPKRMFIEALSEDQLERILIEPKKALVVQKRLLLASTTDLRFTKGALRAIAEEAKKMGTNGRALREIMEQVLEPVVYNEPPVAIITAAMVFARNEEIEGQNREDDGVETKITQPFIVEDDDVEATLASATAAIEAAAEARKHALVPVTTGREVMVIDQAPKTR